MQAFEVGLLLRSYINEWHGWYDQEHGYFDRQEPDLGESQFVTHALFPEASLILYDEHDADNSSYNMCVVC